ncbi:hypothetical protein [Actinomycetospora aeridis]|uniref:Beta-lactamase superfamily II metal-dependent hydrolase n=1 Tax=Actinomycetospora aeridis TaxID=3129231 RepID=A0ABU8N0H1_9PSEU
MTTEPKMHPGIPVPPGGVRESGGGAMNDNELPELGAVFWPVGIGDSTTLVLGDDVVVQIDLHDMDKADDDTNPEVPVVDRLVEALPTVDDRPYLSVFALTHADKDHCLGFADLLEKATIGELWATPRLWREYINAPDGEGLCPDAQAFQREAERRVAAIKAALAGGRAPAHGDRIIIIGYDTEQEQHAYSELPAEFKSGPGHEISMVDGVDCSDRFRAFIHAPFAADCAEERNDTSLAMQITLTHGSGTAGRLLLLGDLAHDTIMKIIDYSEDHDRAETLEWDVLLAAHHCSKKVMYETGTDRLLQDVLDAFERHAVDASAVVVASSAPIPGLNHVGDNPPHRKAANRYEEIAELRCTMSWPSTDAPEPIVFLVDEHDAGMLSAQSIELAAAETATAMTPMRLGRVAAAAAVVAGDVAGWDWPGPGEPEGDDSDRPQGLEGVREAVVTDRGEPTPPQTPVTFGR